MADLKPIETIYNGYRFRSRLEARWAVFFDSLGIPWVYEPEGVVIDDVCYLPDFYLPDCKQFFEVKGILDEEDDRKIQALISAGYSVTVGYDNGKFFACDNWSYPNEPNFSLSDCEGWLCKCFSCGKYWFMAGTGIYTCQCCGEYDGDHGFVIVMQSWDYIDHKGIRSNGGDTSLWDVARRARFEHGETPTPNRRY